jgi:hypothetical protein
MSPEVASLLVLLVRRTGKCERSRYVMAKHSAKSLPKTFFELFPPTITVTQVDPQTEISIFLLKWQELRDIHSAAVDLLKQAEFWRGRRDLWGETGSGQYIPVVTPKTLFNSSLETLASLCRHAGLKWGPASSEVIVLLNAKVPESLGLKANFAFKDLGSVLRELGASEEPSQRPTFPPRLLQDAPAASGESVEPTQPLTLDLVLWPPGLEIPDQPPTEGTVKRLRDVVVRLGELADLLTEGDPSRSTDSLPERQPPLTPCERDCIRVNEGGKSFQAASRTGVAPTRPRWDRKHTLWYGDKVARTVSSQAKYVRLILDAFEKAGFPTRIPNPLDDSDARIKDPTKLHDYLKSMNYKLEFIKFRADGTGGIIWEKKSPAPKRLGGTPRKTQGKTTRESP